jgi:hypothetical protein
VEVARGIPCESGIDGRLEIVEQARVETPSLDGTIDQRARTSVTAVKAGSVLARVHPPQAGKDGVDIFGAVVRAKSGRAIRPRVDGSVVVRADGTVVALRAGLATVTEDRICVQTVLRIEGTVDFETGNIAFPGDVVIEQGVRDCFVVQADGDMTVHDLVDAAKLDAGGSVALETGMAARGQGTLRVGKDLRAKYLTDLRGDVGRDAEVQREIANCSLSIGRDLKGGTCTIVRGTITVGGRCEVCDLGSDANVPTTLVLGEVGDLGPLGDRAVGLLDELEKHQLAAQSRLNDLRGGGRSKDAQQAEVLTALQFHLNQLKATTFKLRTGAVRLVRAAHTHAKVNLRVSGMIYPKVSLHAAGKTALFAKPLRGPLLIDLDETGELRVTDLTTKQSQPLAKVAQVSVCERSSGIDVLKERFAGELLIGDGSTLVA